MLKIGLTGGIGSGKTTVAMLFEKRGVPIIDADQISHALTEPGMPGLERIVASFGTEVLDTEGRLSRSTMREIIFSSPAQKELLESILHPLVYDSIDKEVCNQNTTYCILSVPLLIETKQCHRVDRVLVVDVPAEIQLARVKARDGLKDEEIERIVSTQAPRETKLAIADDVISNASDISSLDKQVEKLHNFYLEFSDNTGLSN